MALYDLYGLKVESEFGLPAPLTTGGHSDVRVEWGTIAPVPLEVPPGEILAEVSLPHAHYSIVREADRYTLTYTDVCRVVVDQAMRRVRLDPVSEESRAVAAVLFAGNVLASLLTIKGDCVLHASAVETERGGIAFVGAPGTGKSTMAGLLCADGGRLVTDDVLRLLPHDEGFRCAPGTNELRLRTKAAPLADVLPGEARPIAGERVGVTLKGERGAVPLRAIVFPHPTRDRPDMTVERVDPVDALARLMRFPRTLGWVDAQILERTFRWNAELARTVPAYVARVPWGPPFRPDIGAELLSLLDLPDAAGAVPLRDSLRQPGE